MIEHELQACSGLPTGRKEEDGAEDGPDDANEELDYCGPGSGPDQAWIRPGSGPSSASMMD